MATIRVDSGQIADALGTLAQAFHDCADALLMARDAIDEAEAVAEREGEEVPPPFTPACTCGGGLGNGLHSTGCAVTGGVTT